MLHPRTLGSFAATRHRRFSIYHAVHSSLRKPPLPNHARLACKSQQRSNHQTTRGDPAAGATAKDVERWYKELDLKSPSSFDEVKKRYYALSKIYHPDCMKDQSNEEKTEAKDKLSKVQHLYEKFCSIQASGKKEGLDKQIVNERLAGARDAADRREKAAKAERLAQAVRAMADRRKKAAEAERTAQTLRDLADRARRAKQIQKEKDDAIKKAQESKERTTINARDNKSKMGNTDAAKKKLGDSQGARDETRPDALNEAAAKAGHAEAGTPDHIRDSMKTTTTARNSQHTLNNTTAAGTTKVGRNTGKEQTKKDTKSAQPERKQDLAGRRPKPKSRLAIRDADTAARSRIVRLYEIPDWVVLGGLCRSLIDGQPGAIFDCRLEKSTAMFEFFNSAAARRMLSMVESGGMVVRQRPESSTMIMSFTVTKARLDVAAEKKPYTTFLYRILSFRPTDAASQRACQDLASLLALLRQYGVRPPRMVECSIPSNTTPLTILFASVKDAETVAKALAKWRPDIVVRHHLDYVGSVPHARDAKKPAGSQSNDDGQEGNPKRGTSTRPGSGDFALSGLVSALFSWL